MECVLTEDWKDINDIIIYGFGKVAHDNLDFFKDNFNIVYIVDGDKSKCDIEYKDIPVKYVEDVKEKLKDYNTI
jgi:NADH/NAD ratio-sensing transcriptional regulator Rex